MHLILLTLLLVLVIFAPQWWVGYVLARYNREEEFPGSGSEFARHLLTRFDLQDVKVEEAGGEGDHYDTQQRVVRLAPDKYHRKSLTAITTAAHEVGHAIQHSMNYGPFLWRLRLAKMARVTEKLGSFLLFAVPVLALITRTPAAGAITFLAAMATIGVSVVVQLLTLPVEWDASFTRAMPILETGYIDARQQKAAKRILRACAFTYVASSLAGLLNFWRWARVLKP
ncbi:MAG: peptidase [Sedimenticola sp.]|nr:MAG: peptidase [Sedimenticola sp.]